MPSDAGGRHGHDGEPGVLLEQERQVPVALHELNRLGEFIERIMPKGRHAPV